MESSGIMKSSNKGIIIFFLVLGLSIYQVYPAQAYGEGVDLHLITSELSPMPVEPGKDLVLSVTVDNEGRGTADNLTLEIIPDPAIIIKNANKQILRKDLCGHCAWAETYYLHIDPSAVSGVYKIEIKALREGVGTSKTIDVIVKGVPQITLCDVSIKPEIISPGSYFNLNYSVCNKGTGDASAIRIASLLDNLPFVPIGTNTLMIEKLPQNISNKLEYNLLAKEDAKPASYSIPIRLDYQSEDGRNFSSSELVGVNVLGKSRLNIAGISNDPSRIEKGSYVTLTIRIENAGNGDAKSVKANIDIPFTGTKTAFLGKIEPDNDAPAIFNLRADDAGDYRYNLTIQYEDDLGTHEINETLEMVAYSGGSVSVYVIILLIIATVGVYWFFIRRK